MVHSSLCIAVIAVQVAFVAKAHAKQPARYRAEEAEDSMDKLVDNLVERTLKISSLNHADLEETTLGKPGQVAMPGAAPHYSRPGISSGSIRPVVQTRACKGAFGQLSRRDALTAILVASVALLPVPTNANTAAMPSTNSGKFCAVMDDDPEEKKSQISNPKKFVADSLKEKGIVVFGKRYCSCTSKWLTFLEDEKAEMTVHYLDDLGEPKNGPVQQELEKITGVLSVPQVFVNGKFIGGGLNLDWLKAPVTLRKKLQSAGATFRPALIQSKSELNSQGCS